MREFEDILAGLRAPNDPAGVVLIPGVASALRTLAQERAEEVKSTGESITLPPMNAFERKVIHDTIGELGLASESEGEEPNRCVVILPAS